MVSPAHLTILSRDATEFSARAAQGSPDMKSIASLLRLTVTIVCLSSGLLLAGCGGGGGGSGAAAPVLTPPTISAQPASVTVNDQATATFSVTATGSAPLAYQWLANGTAIVGATGSTYSISAASLASSGTRFTVTVSNSAGSVTSTAATLTVQAVAPTISAQPINVSVNQGGRANFSVAARGSAPLAYQWLSNGAPIVGATSSVYSISPVLIGSSGASFTVTVSNVAGTITSTPATLTVLGVVPPTISVQPSNVTVSDGSTATFSVTASGGMPLAYQWLANGLPILKATASTYSITAASLASSGTSFTVTVSNGAGSITSNPAVLTVTALKPTITTEPQAQNVLAGATATFGVVANGSAPLGFQWRKNSANISGATSASYVTPATTGADSGSVFDVIVSNTAGAVTSAAATLTVAAPTAPTITTQPQNASTTVGGTATFTVQATGTAPLSYQWKRNGAVIAGATNANYTISPVTLQNNNDAYTVTVRNTYGSVDSTPPAQLTLTAAPPGINLLVGQLGGPGALDATGSAARFYNPAGVAIDPAGNIYVADSTRSTIRKVSPTGVVTTVAGTAGSIGAADGNGPAAKFRTPTAVALDPVGNLYVADTGNNTIRMITPAGAVSTLAGTAGTVGSADGSGAAASFNAPQGVATDAAGNVYVADTGNSTVRVITPAGLVSTLAGSAGLIGAVDAPMGPGSVARFNMPAGITVDAASNVYLADTHNVTIRKITPAGVVTTIAGTALSYGSSDGTGPAAQFSNPGALAVDSSGNLYVADSGNNKVRQVTPAAVVTTIAGSGASGSQDGAGAAAQFQQPAGIAIDAAGNLYLGDYANHTIRKISPAAAVTTLAGRAPQPGSVDGAGARFYVPQGVATDAAGNVYVVDTNNHTIRAVTAAGVASTLAGAAGVSGSADGTGSAARFNLPSDLALDAAGNLYVTDTGNNTIRKVTPAGVVTTVAGAAGSAGAVDGTGGAARFNDPKGIAVDASGNLYVVDRGNNTIRSISPAGAVTTLAGSSGVAGAADGAGSTAQFNAPVGLTIDAAGNLYVADYGNNTIRQITAGVVTTLAGTAGPGGSADGTAGAAQFQGPTGVAIDSAGNLYVADYDNHEVRMIAPGGTVTTLAGVASSEGVVLGALPGVLNTPTRIAVAPGPTLELAVSDSHENSILVITSP